MPFKGNFKHLLQLKEVRRTSILTNLQKLKCQLTLNNLWYLQFTFYISKFYLISWRRSRFSSTFLRSEEKRPGPVLLVRLASSPTSSKSLRELRSRSNMSPSSHAMLLSSEKEALKLISLKRLFLRSCMLRWLATATK